MFYELCTTIRGHKNGNLSAGMKQICSSEKKYTPHTYAEHRNGIKNKRMRERQNKKNRTPLGIWPQRRKNQLWNIYNINWNGNSVEQSRCYWVRLASLDIDSYLAWYVMISSRNESTELCSIFVYQLAGSLNTLGTRSMHTFILGDKQKSLYHLLHPV